MKESEELSKNRGGEVNRMGMGWTSKISDENRIRIVSSIRMVMGVFFEEKKNKQKTISNKPSSIFT